jgi:hypothetical protein
VNTKTPTSKSSVLSTLVAALAATGVIGLMAPVASIAAPLFNAHPQLVKGQCDNPHGTPVVDVNQKVVNDVDSGNAGNYWAFDTYSRHIQVWKQVDGDFCAIINYSGAKFDAVAGQTSPGTTGVLAGNEDGPFDGGYRATIAGTLLTSPTWATRGNAGTFDYGCDLFGNCSGYVSWTDQYFAAGYVFNYEWWGWEYKGAHHHTWVNSSDGTFGDVM